MRVFRFDRKKKTLVIQSLMMIIVGAMMLFTYQQSKQIIYLVIFVLSLGLVGVYFYRMFFMRFIFSDKSVIFKGLFNQIIIRKDEIFDIQFIQYVGGNTLVNEYSHTIDNVTQLDKSYIKIRVNGESKINSISMFNAANQNHILLEYVPGLEVYLDKLLQK